MAFCLLPKLVEKFKQGLKDGTIDPVKMKEMTSEERHNFLADIVGKENAKEVNALFESKLLLKDQQKGMINWAKQSLGMKAEVRKDIISRIEKMDKVLNPAEEKAFLNDLADKRLGTDVTFEEAKQLTEFSKKLVESKANLKESEPAGSPARLEYGANKIALQNYVKELKLSNNQTKLSAYLNPIKLVKEIAATSKGIKASLDNSAIFRQGWKTLFTNPQIWARNAAESFVNIAKQLGRKATDDFVMNGIKAEIASRPNAVNGTYDKMKLDIGNLEEAFPTTLPEKIPLFGRLYKASETAYTGFLYKMRADIADKMIEIAKKNGVNVGNKEELQSIGNLVNSLTGRGNLGAFEKVGKEVNTIFFSPKMLKSNIDFLTAHQFQKGVTPFVRKQAALNLLKVIAGTAVILGTAKALDPNSVELDSRSSDFGKIKVGKTRFDVSGGMSSIITLASRLVLNSSKSTKSHKIIKLNSNKFGSQTSMDVVSNFLQNKLSPVGSLIKNIANRRDFAGKKITVQGEAVNLLAPLPITNAIELLTTEGGANALIGIIADALGISTNTY